MARMVRSKGDLPRPQRRRVGVWAGVGPRSRWEGIEGMVLREDVGDLGLLRRRGEPRTTRVEADETRWKISPSAARAERLPWTSQWQAFLY